MASGRYPDPEEEDRATRPSDGPTGAGRVTVGPEDIWTSEDSPASTQTTDPSATRSVEEWRTGKRAQADEKGGRGFAFLRELPFLLLVAFLLALLIKTFVVQAFYITSESMEPTLNIGDRVLVNKVVYHLHPPRRGDIIVFEDPHPTAQDNRNVLSTFWHWLTEGFGVSTNPEKDFIKRVVGLPGDTVAIRHCKVMINGKVLQEPYKHVRDCREYGPHRVPKDNVFVMGDNRPNSSDSRFALRDIPEDKIVGRAFVIIWPPSRWQILRR